MNTTEMKPNTDKITFTMFKITGGRKIQEFNLQALSDSHAVEVATQLYNRFGLIGRYYCQTSTGGTFSIQ